jgi:hypothetical protein
MFERHTYKDAPNNDWTGIKNPVATRKWDGAAFFAVVQPDGSLRYYSRRRSVKGHFPDRTDQLPQLTQKKLPQYAGNVYHVELIHTGKDKTEIESHAAVSGILNSGVEKSIQTQENTGPVRAVLLNVVSPELTTYKEKLLHMKEVEKAYGNPDVLFVAHPHITPQSITSLVEDTKHKSREGVIVTSLTEPENNNPRFKVKHYVTHNLKVVGMLQEKDIHGNLKPSMGAVTLADRSGRVVGDVGSGFTKQQREEYWKNPSLIIGDLIQVRSVGLGSVGGRLRHPIYNGIADGVIDLVT